MGCRVLPDRISKRFEMLPGVTIHQSVGVTGLFKGLPPERELVFDFGKDDSGLAYLQAWKKTAGGDRCVGQRLAWPFNVLEQQSPDDFKVFAAELKRTPDTLMNFLRDKAKSLRFSLN